ncbi:MAG TPA: hypothetical protein VK815_08350 [Candidatus Acidoferrales bacterium]|jgi:hypothetical protein|nr:hypothetical protein [Candidatus Acidoferrales bacterium]
MKVLKRCFPTLGRILCGAVFGLILAGAGRVPAATVWTGSLFTFNQPAPNPKQATNQDRITPDVWLTRANSKGLFNAFYETNATALSPTNTEWAFGSLSDYASLNYTNWLALLNGASPTTLVGQPLVVHLISDDIYLSLKITFWGAGGTGGFTYDRSTPTPPPTFWTGPTITFTHDSGSDATDFLTTNHVGDDAINNVWLTRGFSQPLYNAAAESSWSSTSPANTLWAVASGDLTNADTLTYDTFGNVVGQPHNSPVQSVGQTFFVKIVTDNIYFSLRLDAWGASDGGGFAYTRSTPAAVVVPVPVILSGATLAAGRFSFSYTADAGLAYVVQSSSNLVDWVSLSTNVAPGSPVLFTNAVNPAGASFYRIGRLPNP